MANWILNNYHVPISLFVTPALRNPKHINCRLSLFNQLIGCSIKGLLYVLTLEMYPFYNRTGTLHHISKKPVEKKKNIFRKRST
jgi:hypothetical protein